MKAVYVHCFQDGKEGGPLAVRRIIVRRRSDPDRGGHRTGRNGYHCDIRTLALVATKCGKATPPGARMEPCSRGLGAGGIRGAIVVSSWIEKLAGKGRRGGNGVLVQISREVVGRKRSIQGAISEVRHPAVLDALSDDDFDILGELIEERVDSDREFSQVLARLTHAAAHAKGFDRQTVDAALRLDMLLPSDDPA